MCVWPEDEAKKRSSVSDVVVTEEAEQLNSHYEESWDMQKGSFHASKGWIANWQNQMSLQNAKGIQELSSADCVNERFRKITEDKNYLPQQTLNNDETGFRFKHKMLL